MFIVICVIFILMTSSLAQLGPITPDFEDWLQSHGYGSYNFARHDMHNYGSFGGRSSSYNEFEDSNMTPVVFIHGNSDAALKANNFSTGWHYTVEYFLRNGYSMAQLYATSWGDTNTTQAIFRDHDCHTVTRLRKFVEAVLEYTGSKKVSLLSHSMGVTLARKIVAGGFIEADDGNCFIGQPLSHRVRAFVGIAGANYGLCNCVGHGAGLIWPTCNFKNGLWPGESCLRRSVSLPDTCGEYPMEMPCNAVEYSTFLMEMNLSRQKPAEAVFSMWSEDDLLIGWKNMVWGRKTSQIPFSQANLIYKNYTHMETKERTFADQFYLITYLKVPPGI